MLLKVTMKKRCNKYYLMDSVLKKMTKKKYKYILLRSEFKKKIQNNDEYLYKTLEQSGLKKK